MRHAVIWPVLALACLLSGVSGAFFAAPFVAAGAALFNPRARAALVRAL